MFDDFFVRALAAGIGVALVAGPLGCFVVWRRLAYFGDTLAHAALLGVALALIIEINMVVAVFAVSVAIAMALLALERRAVLSSDALLGLLSHSSLAIGLVVLGLLSWLRVDLTALLFGDILSVAMADLVVIWVGGVLVLAALAAIWNPLLAATVNRELAEAEGRSPRRAELVFMVLLAAVIAIAIKIVGVLLITALLIIPAAGARRLSTSPEMMAVVASVVGCAAVVGGLYGSLAFDTPSGPSIVVAALVFFLTGLALPRGGRKRQNMPGGADGK